MKDIIKTRDQTQFVTGFIINESASRRNTVIHLFSKLVAYVTYNAIIMVGIFVIITIIENSKTFREFCSPLTYVFKTLPSNIELLKYYVC